MIPLHDDNPTERTPVVTIACIAACVLVFFYQASLPAGAGDTFVFQYGAIPALVFGQADLPEIDVAIPAYATLVTSMFLHGGWMHLIGNMLYLWIFGNNIEDVMGHAKYVVFYLTCGILAALSHALTDPSSTIPMVGASGAISGVLGAYVLLFPRAQRAGSDARPGHDEGGSGYRPRHVVRDATIERRNEPRQYRAEASHSLPISAGFSLGWR